MSEGFAMSSLPAALSLALSLAMAAGAAPAQERSSQTPRPASSAQLEDSFSLLTCFFSPGLASGFASPGLASGLLSPGLLSSAFLSSGFFCKAISKVLSARWKVNGPISCSPAAVSSSASIFWLTVTVAVSFSFFSGWHAVSAKTLGVYGCFYHIGIVAPAAVAQGGKLVDVYAQLNHAQNYSNTVICGRK